MKIQRILNGSTPTKIQICGEPSAVRSELFRLFNVGVVTTIPDSYKEGEDSNVICNTYRKRFLTGLRALAEISMQKDATRHTVRAGKREWHTRASVRAAHIFRSEFTIARKRREDEGEE